MARPSSRTPRWLLGLAVPAAVTLAGGCDTDAGRADKAVEASLRKADEVGSGSPADRTKALDAAAHESSASLPLQIRTFAQLAAAEMQMADAQTQAAATNSADIDRMAREIGGLTHSIAADNQLVVSLGKYQPQPALDALAQQKGAVAGSDDKPDWVRTDAGTLASTAATDKAASALQGQIAQLEQQVKSETDQRNDLMTKSDQLTQQSTREQHQQSVDLFTQGADARKQAADLAVKIDQDNSQLVRARADLAVQAAQQDALKAAAKGIDDRATAINQSWESIGEQIKAIKAHSTAQLGEATEPALNAKVPPTINGEAAALAKLVKTNRGIRDEAETHYGAAIGFYKDAYDRATQLKMKLAASIQSPERTERADREAWAVEKSATDPAHFQYLQSTALLERASFHARWAAEAKAVAAVEASVKPVLTEAGLAVPGSLEDVNGDAAKLVTDQQKLADAGFKDATDNLSNVTSGDAPAELKHGADVATMLGQYGWSLLAAASGDGAGATTHMQAASTAQANAIQSGPLPPMLPAELAPAPVAPTPGAAPAPGTTP